MITPRRALWIVGLLWGCVFPEIGYSETTGSTGETTSDMPTSTSTASSGGGGNPSTTSGTAGGGNPATGGGGSTTSGDPCDKDGDGQKAEGPCAGDDCNDEDKNVFGGQTKFFPCPIPDGDGGADANGCPHGTSFDYDCDGVETPKYADACAGSASPCDPSQYLAVAAGAAGCGQKGELFKCANAAIVMTCTKGASADPEVTQACH